MPAYLVASTVERCKRPADPDEHAAASAALGGLSVDVAFEGAGCEACRNTGYRGRVGAYEMFSMTPALRDAVGRGVGGSELRSIAVAEGMRTLADDAARLVGEGVTTISESMRVVGEP